VELRPVIVSDAEPSSRSFPVEGQTTPLAPRATTKRALARAPAAAATGPKHEGRVTERRPGEVVVDLGRRDGVRLGESVELSVVETQPIGGESALARSVVAVGEVTAAAPGHSVVALGIGERAPLGALARLSGDDATATRAAPPRLGGLWEVGFMARPFVALNDLGGGFLLDASVGYRFESDFHLEAVLAPLGYGTGADFPSVVPVATYLKASYDLSMFELGVGVGAGTVNSTSMNTPPGSGTLFVQQLRLGAAEGTMVDFSSRLVLFHSQVAFTGLVGAGQVPVGRKSWLVLRGGGGDAGYGYGELGVRTLLKGNGDRGSFYFTGTVGGVGVYKTATFTCRDSISEWECTERIHYAGPMLGAGAEWRL
jgi:hypothetical protein